MRPPLAHLEKFAWIGSFSGAVVMFPRPPATAPAPAPAAPTGAAPGPAGEAGRGGRGPGMGLTPEAIARVFPALDAKANAQIKLLWIGCGSDDSLLSANRQLKAFLDSKSIKMTYTEFPGYAYVWPLWRRNLTDFAPLLFKEKK